MNVNTLFGNSNDNIFINHSSDCVNTGERIEFKSSHMDNEDRTGNPETTKTTETTGCGVVESDNNETHKHVESGELYEEIQICRDVKLSSDRDKTSYYQRNKERILEYARDRYKNNREKLLAYSKSYQGQRKDEVSLRNAEYYYNNKESLLLKRSKSVTCSCGRTITKGAISNHLKTKYHEKHTKKQG